MEPIASSDPASAAPATSGPCHTCHIKAEGIVAHNVVCQACYRTCSTVHSTSEHVSGKVVPKDSGQAQKSSHDS